MERKKYKNRFLIKQRAFLKLYLLGLIEKRKDYGLNFLEEIREEFKELGYKPTHSELYKSLHSLAKEGWVERIRKVKGDPKEDFQEIILYRLTEEGKKKKEL